MSGNSGIWRDRWDKNLPAKYAKDAKKRLVLFRMFRVFRGQRKVLGFGSIGLR
jgi:hypothetical protein